MDDASQGTNLGPGRSSADSDEAEGAPATRARRPRRHTALRDNQPVETDPVREPPQQDREEISQSPQPAPSLLRTTLSQSRNSSSLDGGHSLDSDSWLHLTVREYRELYNDPTALRPLETAPGNGGGSESALRSDKDKDEGLAQISDAVLFIQHPVSFGRSTMAGNNNSFHSLDLPNSGNNRAPLAQTSLSGGQANGNGMVNPANYMAPLPVGHQQDLNYLFSQIQELSAILKNNREKTSVVTKAAEEVARRANTNGVHVGGEGSHEGDAERIRELEHELVKSNQIVELYKHEQTENTNLIAMYEDALGNATEGIRNYCLGIEERFLAQRRHYNNLLQQEKDEHLQSRLDREYWHAKTLGVCEMVRTANRLRTDEWCEEYTIISGLQSEVRCLRRCLGMEAEKAEEETGYPYLRDMPLNDTS